MQLLFSSVSRSKQRQFGNISVCVSLTLEEASALPLPLTKKTNKCIVLIALNAVFPYYLSGMWEAKGLRGKKRIHCEVLNVQRLLTMTVSFLSV